jgi:hypothetical protein
MIPLDLTFRACLVHGVSLKFKFFCIKWICFYVFKSFWCAHIKNNFRKIKKIILMLFEAKNTLNRHRYHNPKHIFNFFFQNFKLWNICLLVFSSKNKKVVLYSINTLVKKICVIQVVEHISTIKVWKFIIEGL